MLISAIFLVGFSARSTRARISSLKRRSSAAVACAAYPATSPSPFDDTEIVLGSSPETVVRMAEASSTGDAENRRRVAPCWLPAVLEMALQDQTSGRPKTGQPQSSSANLQLYDLKNGFFIPNDRKKYSVGENASRTGHPLASHRLLQPGYSEPGTQAGRLAQ